MKIKLKSSREATRRSGDARDGRTGREATVRLHGLRFGASGRHRFQGTHETDVRHRGQRLFATRLKAVKILYFL
jgi:hypothetical protein